MKSWKQGPWEDWLLYSRIIPPKIKQLLSPLLSCDLKRLWNDSNDFTNRLDLNNSANGKVKSRRERIICLILEIFSYKVHYKQECQSSHRHIHCVSWVSRISSSLKIYVHEVTRIRVKLCILPRLPRLLSGNWLASGIELIRKGPFRGEQSINLKLACTFVSCLTLIYFCSHDGFHVSTKLQWSKKGNFLPAACALKYIFRFLINFSRKKKNTSFLNRGFHCDTLGVEVHCQFFGSCTLTILIARVLVPFTVPLIKLIYKKKNHYT